MTCQTVIGQTERDRQTWMGKQREGFECTSSTWLACGPNQTKWQLLCFLIYRQSGQYLFIELWYVYIKYIAFFVSVWYNVLLFLFGYNVHLSVWYNVHNHVRQEREFFGFFFSFGRCLRSGWPWRVTPGLSI